MSRTISVPVTYGQLFVLRQQEVPGNNGHFPVNQSYVSEIPPGVSLKQVMAAWTKVVRDNEALRTNFDLGAPRPLQLIHEPDDEILLPCHEFGTDGIEAAYDHANGLTNTPIDIASEAPARVFIGLDSGRPNSLGFAIHHAAADHLACLSIDRQFQAALRGEMTTPPVQPSALAHEQQQNVHRHGHTIDYWAERWRAFSTTSHTQSQTVPRNWAHLYSREAMQAANAVAAAMRVPLQAVLLGVAGVVATRLTGQQDHTIGLVSGNRLGPRWSDIVTNMYQIAPVQMAVDQTHSPTAFIREAALNSYEAYMRGIYDVDRLRAKLTAVGLTRSSLLFDTYFNFLGETGDDVPEDHVWSHSVEVRPLQIRVGPRVQYIFATGPGLHIQIRATEDYVSADRLGHLVAAVEAGIVSLAEKQPSTLDEISLDPIRGIG